MEIPWGWATNPDDRSFCLSDRFSIGYITPEDIASYEERIKSCDIEIRTNIADDSNFVDEKHSSRILLAADCKMSGAKAEVERLRELFLEHNFTEELKLLLR